MKYFWIEATYGDTTKRIKFKTEKPMEDIRTMIFLGAATNHTYWVFDNTIKNTAANKKHLSGINLSRADEILVYPL